MVTKMIIDAPAHVFANPRIELTPDTITFMSAADEIAVMDFKRGD
jgi:hypothetical protein